MNFSGGEGGIRTLDTLRYDGVRDRSIQPLSHLSVLVELFIWCAWEESNLRPYGPQPYALSPELQAQILNKKPSDYTLKMAFVQ